MWSGGKDDDKGSSSGGSGFFGRLLGGETLEDFEGRYINTLKSRHIEAPVDLSADRTGLQLARREALGPHNVPVPLPEMAAYAQKIVERLLTGAAISGFVPAVHIVADQSIHGQAFPDGTILLPLGAIRNLESEDQLAALLAHEMAHIILGHHGSDWFLDTQERGLAALQFALDMREDIERMRGGSGHAAEHLKMKFIAKGVVFASELLVDSPFTRLQEDQADLLGFDLLHAGGYSIREMTVLLDKLAEQEKLRLEAAEQRQADRVAALEKLGSEGGGGNIFKKMFETSQELFDGLLDEIKEEVAGKHRAAEERREAIRKYLKREYRKEKRIAPEVGRWAEITKRPEVADAIAGYRHVYEARSRLAEGVYPDAVDEIRKALGYLGPRHGAPRLAAALISARAGIPDEAAFYFTQSLSAEKPLLTSYTGYAELMRKQGKFDDSKVLLDRAIKEFSDAPQLLPDLIDHARIARTREAGQNKLTLAALLTRCKLSPLKKLSKLCKLARKGRHTNLGRLQVAEKRPLGFDGALVRIKGASLNVRKGPGGKFPVLTSFKSKIVLSVLDTREKWLLVRSADGREGWVAGWLTQKVPQAAAPRLPAVRPVATGAPAPRRNVAPAKPASRDVETRLLKLKNLHDKGLVTDSEYKAKREEILNAL